MWCRSSAVPPQRASSTRNTKPDPSDERGSDGSARHRSKFLTNYSSQTWTRFTMALNGRNPAARKEVAMKAERHVMRHPRSRQLGEVDGVERQQERGASSHIEDYRENHALILGACVRRRHEHGLAGIAARLAP